jgi:chaperonin GroEL (HSP60 family)
MPYQVTITEDAKVRTELHNFKQLQEIIRDFNGSKGMSKLIIKKVH